MNARSHTEQINLGQIIRASGSGTSTDNIIRRFLDLYHKRRFTRAVTEATDVFYSLPSQLRPILYSRLKHLSIDNQSTRLIILFHCLTGERVLGAYLTITSSSSCHRVMFSWCQRRRVLRSARDRSARTVRCVAVLYLARSALSGCYRFTWSV